MVNNTWNWRVRLLEKTMGSKAIKIIGAISILFVFSCKTYTIPVDSFREQMIGAKPENRVAVEINNPLFYENIKYYSNNISRLTVFDKKGNESYLDISPAIEMRVTHKNGEKYILYFDTVILENDTLKGGRSRFAQGLTRAIPLDSIVKIEVQDGGKKFGYQKQSNIN
ncbi:hypothetical protein [Flagellimonas sediminis]|uniref:Uncharacterized protein n=1 Tax=Flagellimonas sediminis TaxID=2696468 RepID=A0A6I5KWM6_9FLAO|nr:hypothetical protein [Allomuricauda sediminis]NDV42782.1 hypothetical protein [Allomuricauda sediminis]